MKAIAIAMLFTLLLVSCGGDQPRSDVLVWQEKELSFFVETRPPEIRPGMMEFLIVANRGVRKRAHDLLVSIRIGEMGRWTQAIQDGHTGVYRRAIKVSDPKSESLYVHVKHEGDEQVFAFPLSTFKVPQ